MKDNVKVVQQGGIGFVGVLQIVFIVLKLCGVINWNWWLVLLPAIIWLGIYCLIFIIVVIVAFIQTLIENRRWR